MKIPLSIKQLSTWWHAHACIVAIFNNKFKRFVEHLTANMAPFFRHLSVDLTAKLDIFPNLINFEGAGTDL